MKLIIVCGLVILGLVLTRGEQSAEGCQKEDGTFIQEDEDYMYSSSDGKCNICTCWEGNISCNPVECDWPPCPDDAQPIYREGQCCPSCPYYYMD